ncbi:hypothetical protein WJ972_09580 [Achromobacter insuavis]
MQFPSLPLSGDINAAHRCASIHGIHWHPSARRHDQGSEKKTRKEDDWSVSHKMRLPHKVGLPLGSGGGGDDGGGW